MEHYQTSVDLRCSPNVGTSKTHMMILTGRRSAEKPLQIIQGHQLTTRFHQPVCKLLFCFVLFCCFCFCFCFCFLFLFIFCLYLFCFCLCFCFLFCFVDLFVLCVGWDLCVGGCVGWGVWGVWVCGCVCGGCVWVCVKVWGECGGVCVCVFVLQLNFDPRWSASGSFCKGHFIPNYY